MEFNEALEELRKHINIFESQRKGARGTFAASNAGTLGGLRFAERLFSEVEFSNMEKYQDGEMRFEKSHDKYHITNIPPAIMYAIVSFMRTFENAEKISKAENIQSELEKFRNLSIESILKE